MLPGIHACKHNLNCLLPLQHHGRVWKADVFGAVLYGIGGAEGLKQFYDEANVKRWPGMSQNLKDAAWEYDVSCPQALSCMHACMHAWGSVSVYGSCMGWNCVQAKPCSSM